MAEQRTPRKHTETILLRDILFACVGRNDLRIWRNNTGVAISGSGKKIAFGLKGSSDLLGILRGGRFLAVETKSPTGRLTTEQQAFRSMVESMGGLYILARSVKEFTDALPQ